MHIKTSSFVFLSAWLLMPSVNASAAIITFEVAGTVTRVYAGIDPLWDPIPPVSVPEPNPAFAQKFSSGLLVSVNYTFDSTATDWYDQRIIHTPNLGIYSAIQSGEVTIGESQYVLEEGDISVQLRHSSTGEDIYGTNAYGYRSSADPVPSNGVNLGFVVARPNLFLDDSLPLVPPTTWSRSNGYLRFFSGIDGLLYEIDFSIAGIRIVPEPSAAMNLAVLLAISTLTFRVGRLVRLPLS